MANDDQATIPCPTCGTPVPYDRMGKGLRDFICSPGCREALEDRYGFKSALQLLEERAEDVGKCLFCEGPMTDRPRLSALFCSGTCRVRMARLGLPLPMRNTLREIRLRAARAQRGVSERSERGKVKT